MLATQDTISRRQAPIEPRGRSMEMTGEDIVRIAKAISKGMTEALRSEMEQQNQELVRAVGALHHAMLEMNRSAIDTMIASGLDPQDAAAGMQNVIRRLRLHADGFDGKDAPSPGTLRAIANSLEGDVREILRQGRG